MIYHFYHQSSADSASNDVEMDGIQLTYSIQRSKIAIDKLQVSLHILAAGKDSYLMASSFPNNELQQSTSNRHCSRIIN